MHAPPSRRARRIRALPVPMLLCTAVALAGCRTSVRIDPNGADDDDPVTGTSCTTNGDQCQADAFCRFDDGTCDQVDRVGVCIEIPDACPEIFAPVCGCNGVTYASECEAWVAGESIDHDGECEG